MHEWKQEIDLMRQRIESNLSPQTREFLLDSIAWINQQREERSARVVDAILESGDLSILESELHPEVAQIYGRLIPRYAQLCELDVQQGLTDAQLGELTVAFASLYPTFGEKGIISVVAAYGATKPMRQARGS